MQKKMENIILEKELLFKYNKKSRFSTFFFGIMKLGDNMYVDVLVELKAKQINQTFTYRVPNEFVNHVQVGKRVKVPFGKNNLEGFIMNVHNEYDDKYKLKDILSIVDDEPVLNYELLELGKYMSKKTMSNLISCYQTMLPTALKAKYNDNTKEIYISFIKLCNLDYEGKNERQRKIIEILKNGDARKSEILKISTSSYNTLKREHVIEEYLVEAYRIKIDDEGVFPEVGLTLEQKNVISDIENNFNKFYPVLLHGVTGSGKTEVYMQLINKIIKTDKTALVLVPEISLTPMIVDRFKSRFGKNIAILHSGLSNGEKYDEWRKIRRGEVKIVIGARSAAFAPLENIGIIIIDEEHSDSYKQDNNPKYYTHDILINRARFHKCPIIFASATPLIESYTRAKVGIYNLLEMKHRVNDSMPEVILVPMQDEIKKGNRILSSKLKELLIKTIEAGNQAIILLNRRGYSTVVTCGDCGYKEICPNCDIPLTYHKKLNILKCHYCDYHTIRKMRCPSCGSDEFNEYGLGTEKLEEELNNLSPKAKVIRMDQDTTTHKGSHSNIIEAFKNGKYNILVGTQMISKGLDFENVTLVGVVNGDQTLNIPDFRSSERTFSLLSQVAGRAGRSDKKGIVVIQGFNLDHYSIKYASMHDYKSFYDHEIEIRRKLNYPPFCNLSFLKIVGLKEEKCLKEANKIASYLSKKCPSAIILGPTASLIAKINNKYQFQIIIKYKNKEEIYSHLSFIIEKYKQINDINIDIDNQPLKM